MDNVRINLNGCKDIFDVILRTIDGEVEYHKSEVLTDSLGITEEYAEGFLAGLASAKTLVEKTRDVNSIFPFEEMFKEDKE